MMRALRPASNYRPLCRNADTTDASASLAKLSQASAIFTIHCRSSGETVSASSRSDLASSKFLSL